MLPFSSELPCLPVLVLKQYLAAHRADENYGEGLGVLGVQVAFEVLVLLVFLWARALAARAFPNDPSAEAKGLIWIIFAS